MPALRAPGPGWGAALPAGCAPSPALTALNRQRAEEKFVRPLVLSWQAGLFKSALCVARTLRRPAFATLGTPQNLLRVT